MSDRLIKLAKNFENLSIPDRLRVAAELLEFAIREKDQQRKLGLTKLAHQMADSTATELGAALALVSLKEKA